MKKRIINVLPGIFALYGIFFFGAGVGKSLYYHLTPESAIQAWMEEYRILDNTLPRTATNEARRLEIICRLAQRGINMDDGIRDEAIENNFNLYTISVIAWWRWEELFGI